MKRIIDFAVSYPRRTLAVLALLTLAFALGIPRLRSEPSTDALMPKHSAEYRMDMRIKKVYGDSKLYLLTLIEGASAPLFSAGSFELIDRVVGEIEEFREFNFAAEELRLRQILDAGGITVIEEMQSADTGDSAASAESESAGDDAGEIVGSISSVSDNGQSVSYRESPYAGAIAKAAETILKDYDRQLAAYRRM